MAVNEPLDELLSRNPQVDVRQVNRYLQYLKDLEAAGIDTKATYQLSHPFSHDLKVSPTPVHVQVTTPTT